MTGPFLSEWVGRRVSIDLSTGDAQVGDLVDVTYLVTGEPLALHLDGQVVIPWHAVVLLERAW